MGGTAPVLVNLLVLDLQTSLLNVTSLVVIGYLIRTAVLFAVGGAVTIFNKESDPVKIFQLGIAAPALLITFLTRAH
jgi:hypothetical protein